MMQMVPLVAIVLPPEFAVSMNVLYLIVAPLTYTSVYPLACG